jgi:hypothetical protein
MRKESIKKQFDSLSKMKVFEIPVYDRRTKELSYLLFDIHCTQRSLVAQCEATTAKEERSKKIAHCKIIIDRGFSLDANLQELYEACTEKIIASEYFYISEH